MLKLFKKKNKDWGNVSDYVIEHIFTEPASGIKLYAMKDIANTYSHRGFAALAIYEEWAMRCSKEYLTGFLTKMDEILNHPESVKLGDLFVMKEELKQRVDFIIPTEDIIYRYAAVHFFDESESPIKYDEAYSKEKIKRWKADKDMPMFFFQQPLKSLMPLPNMSVEDLTKCLAVVNLIGARQVESMLSKLSPEQVKDGLLQELEYQKDLMSTPIG